MTKFDYDDIVRVSMDAPNDLRPGAKAWIIGVLLDRRGSYYDQFPEGIIYSIEYEDGYAVDIHEKYLELFENQS